MINFNLDFDTLKVSFEFLVFFLIIKTNAESTY